MYMPDPALAKQRLDVPPFGRLLRFDVYGLELHQPRDDPYNAVVREMEKEGSHRNVFLVDANERPLWRVSDYEQPYAPDFFVDVSPLPEPEKAKGLTGGGHIFEINLADGSLKKIGWTK
jgi:hypothetical protein